MKSPKNLLDRFIKLIKGHKKYLSIIIYLFIGIFIFSELLTRIFSSPEGITWSEFYFHPKPYTEFRGKPNTSHIFESFEEMGGAKENALITFNKLGFRGKIPGEKASNEFRIIVLGGSSVLHGVPLENSIPKQIEKLFNKNSTKDVKVYNWGVLAFNSSQELSLLVLEVLNYEPDMVIVYDGGNDVYIPKSYEPRPGYPYNWRLYESGVNFLRRDAKVSQILALLFGKSRILNMLFKKRLQQIITKIPKEPEIAQYLSEQWKREIAEGYISNLNKMCLVSRGAGIKFAAFLQPLIYYKKPLVGKEEKLLRDKEFQNYIQEIYREIQSGIITLETESQDSNCHFYDLSYIFKGYNQETFWDFVHTDNDGNKYIADKIYENLKRDRFPDKSLFFGQ